MGTTSFANRWNSGAIEAAYEKWRSDPNSVDGQWQLFFEGFELGCARPPAPAAPPADACAQVGIFRLIHAYRHLGHFLANLDPLSERRTNHPLLELTEFGLDESDLDRTFITSPMVGLPSATLWQLIAVL